MSFNMSKLFNPSEIMHNLGRVQGLAWTGNWTDNYLYHLWIKEINFASKLSPNLSYINNKNTYNKDNNCDDDLSLINFRIII